MTNLMRPKMYEFRQIDDDRIAFMFSLINALLSRIFWQKCVRVNFRNLHTVITHWKVWDFTPWT